MPWDIHTHFQNTYIMLRSPILQRKPTLYYRACMWTHVLHAHTRIACTIPNTWANHDFSGLPSALSARQLAFEIHSPSMLPQLCARSSLSYHCYVRPSAICQGHLGRLPDRYQDCQSLLYLLVIAPHRGGGPLDTNCLQLLSPQDDQGLGVRVWHNCKENGDLQGRDSMHCL